MTVAFLRGMDASDPLRWEPITRGAEAHEEERRVTRSGRVASGTLACARCDRRALDLVKRADSC